MTGKCSVLFASLLFLFTCIRVPITDRRQLQLLPQSEISALSQESYQRILDSIPVVQGTTNAAMVQRVGLNIQNAVERFLREQNDLQRIEGFQWQFTLFDDEVPNAWAMPGGRVGIHTGILPITQDETGMAVVMGHEIAHTVAYHGNERMSQLLLIELGGIALSEALSEQPDLTQNLAMVAFGLGAQIGVILPYSRLHESEADRLGLIFMAMAGYNPEGAVTFWERMEQMREAGEPPEFISTHPSDQTRLDNIREMLPEAMKYYSP